VNKKIPVLLGVAAVSAVAGGIFGYQYAKNELQEQYDIRIEDETEKLRESYSRRYKRDDFETVEKAAESLGAIQGPRSGAHIPAGAPFEKPPVENEDLERIVQALKYDTKPEEDWAAKAAAQDPNPDHEGPHIIPIEQFVSNDLEHYQPTWIFYSQDDILVDESGDVIENRDDFIGRGSLECFGQGSNNIDLVYIRNTDLERDYEIKRVHRKSTDPDPEDSDEEGIIPTKQRHKNRTRS